MILRFVLFALGAIGLWFRICTGTPNNCGIQNSPPLENLFNACTTTQQLQITEAYFCLTETAAGTSHNSMCSPVKGSYYPLCKVQMNLDELNELYAAVDRGRLSLRAFDKLIRNQSGGYHVSYMCADGGSSVAVDPCRVYSIPSSNNYRSILVKPEKRASPCFKTCTLTPKKKRVQLRHNILLTSNADTDNNFLELKSVMKNGHETKWERMDSSYFDDGLTYLNVREMKLRFQFENVMTITRLWILLKGDTFTLTCTDEKIETDTIPSNQELQDNGEVRGAIPLYGYIILAGGVVAILLSFAGIAIVRRKRSKRHRDTDQQAIVEPEIHTEPSLERTDSIPLACLRPLPPIPTESEVNPPAPHVSKKSKKRTGTLHLSSKDRRADKTPYLPSMMENRIYFDSPTTLSTADTKADRFAASKSERKKKKTGASTGHGVVVVERGANPDAQCKFNPKKMEVDIYPDASSTYDFKNRKTEMHASAKPPRKLRKKKTKKTPVAGLNSQVTGKPKPTPSNKSDPFPVLASRTESDSGHYVRLQTNTKTPPAKGGQSYDHTLTSGSLDRSTGYNVASRNPDQKRFVIDNEYDRTK